MSDILLYSTNVYLKYYIQNEYSDGHHYVWCSENFDSAALGRYTPGSKTPPSSNPADIYRSLRDAVANQDRGDLKIQSQKSSFIARAVEWEKAGKITNDEKQELTYMVEHAGWDDWRPLIYVIPRADVETRLALVPAAKRAGFGREYTLQDLHSDDFDIIEI